MAISAARFIREHVLEMSQTELAEALGVTQPAVAKYEKGGTIPVHHRPEVRSLAKKRHRRLEESWFESAPLPNGERHAEEKPRPAKVKESKARAG